MSDDLKLLRETLDANRRESFGDGFADRAAARWKADRAAEPPLGIIVSKQFRKFVPFAIAAALVLAVYNVRHQATSQGQTVAQAMIGITPARTVSIESLYGLDAMQLSR